MILQRDSWTCQNCEATDKTLHVHHVYYEEDEDLEPWEASDDSLVTLCADCHEVEHEAHRLAMRDFVRILCTIGLRTGEQIGLAIDYLEVEAREYHQTEDIPRGAAFAKALAVNIERVARITAKIAAQRAAKSAPGAT